MAISAQHPYDDYKLYRVFDKNQGRFLAVLVSKNHRTTIAYAKYALEVHLGRKLKPNFEAHHKDEDHANDDPNNLEEVERPEHVKRHSRGQTMVSGVCLNCNIGFVRPKRNAKQMKYCSKKCWGLSRRGTAHAAFEKRNQRGISPIVHGTNATYSNHGCRCEFCREAHSQMHREYRKRRAARECGGDL